jgi:TM2 domain-containing membrane protein YozV
MYCTRCGAKLEDGDKFCPQCGARIESASPVTEPDIVAGRSASVAPAGGKSKTAAGLLAIFLGGLGVHKFYLGLVTSGAIMLAIWLFGFFLHVYVLCVAVNVVALVEGVIYLTGTKEQFHERYEVQKKEWF